MVTIEHMAMHVQDLERACAFFGRYFDAPGAVYHNTRTDFRSCFLSFSGVCRLELMPRPQMEDAPKSQVRTGYIHLALSVGSKERVDSLTAQLKSDGYEVVSGPRTTGDGYYESCVMVFEGNLLELTVQVKPGAY